MKDMFSKIIIVGAFLSFSLTAAAVQKGDKLDIKIPHHSDKKELTTKGLQGKVTVINFWATWCAACKVELVEMEEQFKEIFKEKDFQFAFVSLDKNPAKSVKWVTDSVKNPKEFLKYLYKDPTFELAERLEIDSFPMTVVVDQTGKVVFIQRGFKTGSKSTGKIVKLSNRLLAK